MPPRTVDLHPAADGELTDAVARYAAQDVRVATAFLAELRRAKGRIADAPERWPKYLDDTRRFRLRKFPFVIIYRVLNDSVLVLAVAHTSREPNYWRNR